MLKTTFAVLAAAMTMSLAQTASAQELNIAKEWTHRQNGGQQIFAAPGGLEGLSINPAAELASRGTPKAALDSVISQFRTQYPTLKMMGECRLTSNTAVAFLQRPGTNGWVGERVQVGLDQGGATVVVFWSPAARFPAEHTHLFGQPPACI